MCRIYKNQIPQPVIEHILREREAQGNVLEFVFIGHFFVYVCERASDKLCPPRRISLYRAQCLKSAPFSVFKLQAISYIIGCFSGGISK